MIWLVRPRDRLFRVVCKFALCALILVPVEPDRRLADALDDIVNRLPLLLPDGVAEEPSQKTDIVPQGHVFGGGGVEWIGGHGIRPRLKMLHLRINPLPSCDRKHLLAGRVQPATAQLPGSSLCPINASP